MKRVAECLAPWLQRCVPRSLFGRLALLLVVAVLASHVLALTLMFEFHLGPGPRPGGPPPGLALAQRGPPPASPWMEPDGEVWGAESGPPPHEGRGPHPTGLLIDIGVRLAALLLAAWIGARWLAEPIRRLVRAARALGDNIEGPPLPVDGTTECREASQVFNEMQARIRQQLADRDRFVAAVSHDLRTPLTRLRLRTESLEAEPLQRQFRQDIAEMEEMIRSTLDYLSGNAHAEPEVPLDVASLIDSMAEDLRDMGQSVQVAGTAAPLQAQVSALKRCIGNLVENAVRYGGSAEVSLHDEPAQLRIDVADRGPGLPEEELGKVLAPFYRVESSRNRNHGGVGLGLSIAHDIARRHGGQLLLRNREQGGLVASLVLPRVAVPA
ncbi:ATP-binding protein [Variovorax sp. HJSM1_2]|uniref:ATP-binding protein n=1 Tax=Variovorax sp. HJSM1_2 TaxID=3366263 RepID=UPI003BF5281E